MKFLSALGLVLALMVPAMGQELLPVNLTTEYRRDPLGIGEAMPRLAWLLQSSAPQVRGQKQYAYEIRVASTPAMLAHGQWDLWDSGKVFSRATTQIEYAGKPLESGQQCWWQVRVWNGANEIGPWSQPAIWSLGLLTQPDWKADWLGMDQAAMGRVPVTNLVGCQWVWTDENIRSVITRTRCFRGKFFIPAGRKIKCAFLAMTASQSFTAFANGHRVLGGTNRQTLECAEVAYALDNGRNVIAIEATNDGNYPALAGRLEIRFEQGPAMTVDVGGGWISSAHPAAGWQGVDFEDPTWQKVQTLGPVGRQPWPEPTQIDLPTDPAVYLRREFLIEKKIARATLYATALGQYELHLNGDCVGTQEITPPFSDYRQRVYFQTYDVTKQLRLGHNALGIILSDGWYAGYWPSTGRTHNYGDTPHVLAQLEIEFADGSNITICTDDKWRASLGAVRQADAGANVYDGRFEVNNWDDALFRMKGWSMPKIGLTVPEPLVEADPGVPAGAQEVYSGKSAHEEIPGMSLVDFDRPMIGRIRLHARAKRGQIIEIRYGTALADDGSMPTEANATDRIRDIFVAGHNGEFTFEPKFALRHFRYVEVAGLKEPLQPSQVEVVTVYPDVDRTGWFTSNDAMLTRRAKQSLAAEKEHLVETPTNRFLAAGYGAYDENLAPLYYRLLDRISDETRVTDGGAISASSPLDHDPMLRQGTQDAEPIILWDLMQMYNDQRIVRRHFADLADYMHDLHDHWMDYAHHDPFFSDGPNGNTADAEMVALAYAAHVSDLMSQMASQLGNSADSVDYRRMSDELTHDFQERYFNINSHAGLHTPTGYALALQWGLIPDESRSSVADQLQHRIDPENGNLAMGNLGRSQLLFALSDTGHADSAYQLLENPRFKDPWASRWLYEDVAGISPATLGFSHIVIQPRIPAQGGSAKAVYDSTSGRVICDWHADQGQIHLHVSVPINCTAELDLPAASDEATVTESGHSNLDSPNASPGVIHLRSTNTIKMYELQSGNYDFLVNPR